MTKDSSEHISAYRAIADYNKSVLQELQTKYDDLKELVDKKLDALRKRMLKEVKETGEISNKALEEFKRSTSILNTAGNVKGNDLLLSYLSKLEDAICPQWPENFLDELLIDSRFHAFKKVLYWAMGKDKQKWEFIIQEGSKSAYYSRIEDKLVSIKDTIKGLKQNK